MPRQRFRFRIKITTNTIDARAAIAELAGISNSNAIKNPPRAKIQPHNDDHTSTPRRLLA